MRTMPDRSKYWLQKDIQKLLELWLTHSATQIGAKLGRTRSAVCGKIGRLRKTRAAPAEYTGGKAYVEQPRRRRPPPPHKRISKPMEKPQARPTDHLAMRPCLLYELDGARCKWPLGPIDQISTLYCGGTTFERSPYCPHHFKIAFQKREHRP
jgi:hypothetical protein